MRIANFNRQPMKITIEIDTDEDGEVVELIKRLVVLLEKESE